MVISILIWSLRSQTLPNESIAQGHKGRGVRLPILSVYPICYSVTTREIKLMHVALKCILIYSQ